MDELYKFLEKKNQPTIVAMIESLIGLIRNTENVSSTDVKLYLAKYDGLVYKMQNCVYTNMKDDVLTKHKNTLEQINKHFTQAEDSEF